MVKIGFQKEKRIVQVLTNWNFIRSLWQKQVCKCKYFERIISTWFLIVSTSAVWNETKVYWHFDIEYIDFDGDI